MARAEIEIKADDFFAKLDERIAEMRAIPPLPVDRVEILELRPEDTLIVHVDALSAEGAMRLREAVTGALGHDRVLVMSSVEKLEVARPTDEPGS